MAKKIYTVHLSEAERNQLQTIINKGHHKAREIKRANILLLADQGKDDREISQNLNCHLTTVERIRKRYISNGLEFALSEKPRPGQPVKLDGKAEAVLIALACSDPPEGHKKWTMQLLAGQLVERRLLESISDETIRLRLKKVK